MESTPVCGRPRAFCRRPARCCVRASPRHPDRSWAVHRRKDRPRSTTRCSASSSPMALPVSANSSCAGGARHGAARGCEQSTATGRPARASGFIQGEHQHRVYRQHFSPYPARDHRYRTDRPRLPHCSTNAAPPSIAGTWRGWRNNATVPCTYQLSVNDAVHHVTLDVLADHRLHRVHPGPSHRRPLGTLVINGIHRYTSPTTLTAPMPGCLGISVVDRTQQVASRQAQANSGTLKAPMDGAIVDVRVQAGDCVSKSQLCAGARSDEWAPLRKPAWMA